MWFLSKAKRLIMYILCKKEALKYSEQSNLKKSKSKIMSRLDITLDQKMKL